MKEYLVLPIDNAAQYRCAEQRLTAAGLQPDLPHAGADAQKLLHDLPIHQIEREIQNEELQQSRVEIEAGLTHFTEFLDFAPTSYLTLECDGSIREINLAGTNFFGLERSRLRGCHFGSFVAAEYRPAFNAFLAGVFADHAKETIDVALIATGEYAPFVQIEAIADTSGRVCRMAITDITRRRQIESALHESEKRYRQLFGTMLNGFAYCRMLYEGNQPADFVHLDVNDAFGRLTGLRNVIGKRFSEVIPGVRESNPELLDFYGRVASGGQPERFETYVEQLDMWLDISVYSPEKECFVAVFDNITKRKQTENALRLQSEITANAAEGIALIKASDGTICYANPRFETLFGYAQGELTGKHISIINAPAEKSPQEVAAEINGHLEKEGEWSGDVLSRKKDGTTIWTIANVSTFQHPELGTLWIAYQSDITDRKHAQDELQHAKERAEAASRAEGEFLANMSHEIRTPMNSVLGMARLALDIAANPRQRNLLEKILISGEHLLGIIDDILDFSQIEAGKLKIEKADFYLDEVKNKLADMLTQKAVEKGIKLSFDFDPAIPGKLCGDPLRLSQILLNYINNAIKFTERGEITVRARKVGKGKDYSLLRFEVQDTGIGINGEDMAKLFRPFQQADTSITRKYGGSGLGLVISKRLAGLMGGEVGVESEAGKGSTFWFTARLGIGRSGKPKERRLPGRASEADMAAAIKGANILLAEDDLLNQEVATSFLQRAGATVFIAHNGKEALELLRQVHFDCVLMDIQMQVMDGLETTRLIRSDPVLAGMRVIAMTANASNLDRERFLAAGMDDFISKPFKPNMLYATLAKWLAQKPPQAPLLFTSATPAIEAASAGVPELIDFAEMAEFVGDEPEEMRKFVSRFIELTKKDIARIDAALERQDMVEVSAIAHRMLTPAMMVGAKGFADLCRMLEQGKDGGDMQQAREIASQLSPLLERIEGQVKERLG